MRPDDALVSEGLPAAGVAACCSVVAACCSVDAPVADTAAEEDEHAVGVRDASGKRKSKSLGISPRNIKAPEAGGEEEECKSQVAARLETPLPGNHGASASCR